MHASVTDHIGTLLMKQQSTVDLVYLTTVSL